MVSRKPAARTVQSPASPWRAVCVVPAEQSCGLARSLAQHHWLYAEAPRLPLQGCDAPVCNCRYKHLPDRRVADRRRIDRTGLPRTHRGPELRGARRGRRHTDY
ncbi:MAG TPA: hypothetical protein VMF03_03850 [Steroidobacteraceae bacterium]|nr:hypothetical protein [Steroidobacteraceae bacterium]